jgi:hypothetical protein
MSTHFTRIAAEWIMFFTKRPYFRSQGRSSIHLAISKRMWMELCPCWSRLATPR